MKKPELLAPAGNLEKMKIAFEFGADAVYFGLPDFSLRARVNKFDKRTILQAARYCRGRGKKCYLTLNIYAHQRHLKALPQQIDLIKKARPDGVIVSDPGIFALIREGIPKQKIHLSTQANATNSEAVKFWKRQGASRIILAREVSLEEMRQIKKAMPDVELECFVHGAMCMAYSGRCILSKWMAARSANLGDCAQPCRWRYDLKKQSPNFKKQEESQVDGASEFLTAAVVDDQDKFEVNLEEDRHGTYFFNSKDLCLIDYVGELVDCGIDSLKIEGRAKSVYYVALVVRAYRAAIDAFCDKKLDKEAREMLIEEQKNELSKLSNRGYTAGFLAGKEPDHLFSSSSIYADWVFVGISSDGIESCLREIFVHNKVCAGDEVELIMPKGNQRATVVSILNGKEGTQIESAHGGQGKKFKIVFSKKVKGKFLMRKKNITTES